MIWFGVAWAVFYTIAIAVEVMEGAAFGDWPYGLVPFLALVPYIAVLRLLARSERTRRGPLLTALAGLGVGMVLLILRYPLAIAIAQWWTRIHQR